jgi:hypothetical protein
MSSNASVIFWKRRPETAPFPANQSPSGFVDFLFPNLEDNMNRREAIPLIEEAIKATTWRTYLNPHQKFACNIADAVMDKFARAIPDFLDRMGAISYRAAETAEESPIELVNVPVHASARMGQIEWLVRRPVRCALHIIFYRGAFWILDREWFPYPE